MPGRLALLSFVAFVSAGCAQGTLTTDDTVAVDAAMSAVAVSKVTATADNSDSVMLTATVRNIIGAPLPGVRVLFAVTGSYNTLNPINMATDANGVAAAVLTSSYAETKIVSAVANGGEGDLLLPGTPQVTFVPGSATQLVFAVQPSNTQAGNVLTPSVQVTTEDAWGNVATDYNGAVTLALNGGASGVTLLGNTTLSASSGSALFNNLSVPTAGAAYMLVATASGLVTTTSTMFAITAGAPVQLVFLRQPTQRTRRCIVFTRRCRGHHRCPRQRDHGARWECHGGSGHQLPRRDVPRRSRKPLLPALRPSAI